MKRASARETDSHSAEEKPCRRDVACYVWQRGNVSGLSNQNARDEHQHSTEAHLKRSRNPRTVHVAMSDPSDHAQLSDHHCSRGPQRRPEVVQQKRQRVPNAPKSSHRATDQPSNPGMPAPRQTAVIRKRFSKSHADSRAGGRGEAHEECVIGTARRKSRRKNWRQRRYGTIHQPRQAGLHNLQHEEPPLRFLFIGFYIGRKLFLVQFLGSLFVFALFIDEIVKQLPDAGILRALRRLFIEAARLHFHGAGFLAHRLDTQRTNQPKRGTLHKSAHVLPPDEGDMFAKLLAEEFDQPPAVPRFLLAHPLKHCRGRGVIRPQPFGKIRVYPLIFFFQRNRQSQNFAFREFLKLLHGDLAYLPKRGLDKSEPSLEALPPSVLLSNS